MSIISYCLSAIILWQPQQIRNHALKPQYEFYCETGASIQMAKTSQLGQQQFRLKCHHYAPRIIMVKLNVLFQVGQKVKTACNSTSSKK